MSSAEASAVAAPGGVRGNILLALALAVWGAAIVGGMGALWRYKATPGPDAPAPVGWPEGTTVTRDATLPTLVMFAHPKCPCSRASLNELALLMSHTQGRARALIGFWTPEEADASWAQGGLWDRAQELPGVTPFIDRGGAEAKRFGVHTSGKVLLYDTAGVLRFAGGVTSSRGHEGDNAGRDALEALLLKGQTEQPVAAVFGCGLDSKPGETSP